MKKILFVLEKGRNLYYGAETSLKEYIEELSKNKKIEIYLLVRKSLFFKQEDIMNETKRFFKGVNLKKIYILPLPLKNIKISSNLYNNRIRIKGRIAELLNNIIWKIYGKRKYDEILKKEMFTLVHINTLQLYEITNLSQSNYFIHVRNCFEKNILKKDFFNNIKGIIAIANDVYESLKEMGIDNKIIILNNPINGKKIEKISLDDQKEIYEKYKINKEEVIVALIGRISPEKGIVYAIEEFNKLKRKDIKLLIIGDATDKIYENNCKKLAYKNENIKFIPVTSKIELFYSISDYILRSDDIVGLGRTHLEGLFSGNNLIMPGTDEFIDENENLKKYKEKILIYKPQKENELTKILNTIGKVKKGERYSNVEEYTKKMLKFYNDKIK